MQLKLIVQKLNINKTINKRMILNINRTFLKINRTFLKINRTFLKIKRAILIIIKMMKLLQPVSPSETNVQ